MQSSLYVAVHPSAIKHLNVCIQHSNVLSIYCHLFMLDWQDEEKQTDWPPEKLMNTMKQVTVNSISSMIGVWGGDI